MEKSQGVPGMTTNVPIAIPRESFLHPTAAHVEAQLKELIAGYHRLLGIPTVTEVDARPLTSRKKVPRKAAKRNTAATTSERPILLVDDAKLHRRMGSSSARRSTESPAIQKTQASRGYVLRTNSCSSSGRDLHSTGAACKHRPRTAESSTSITAVGAAPAHAATRPRPETAANSRGKIGIQSGSIIRGQLHTCMSRGVGGARVYCAACNGAASRSHVRYLNRESLHRSNLKRDIDEGIVMLQRGVRRI